MEVVSVTCFYSFIAFYFSIWVNLTTGIIKVSSYHFVFSFFSPTLSSFFPFLLLLFSPFLPLCSSLNLHAVLCINISGGYLCFNRCVCVCAWKRQEAWGDSFVCVCVRTHAYKKEWTFNVCVWSVVYAEDEVQMMPVLIGVLRTDRRKPWLETVFFRNWAESVFFPFCSVLIYIIMKWN